MSQEVSVSAGTFRGHIDPSRLIDRLSRLVRTSSENPPGNEAEAGKLAASFCEELGLEVSIHEGATGRPNVIARWTSGEGPTLGYCSHIDVVPAGDRSLWPVDPFGAEIKDGRMHGRGACDAKGPVAAALEAVAVLKEASVPLAGTLELELVSDEETMGTVGAGYLCEQKIIHPDIAIVGEPTSLKVVRAQRGACWLVITTRGVAGHGSAPERGVSAIKHMAEIVARLEETLPDISHDVLGGPSINVGTIKGGEKINIVPASCVIEVDRRSVPPETKEDVLATVENAVERARDRYPDLDAHVEFPFYGEPFEVDEHATIVETVAEATSEACDRPAELAGFRGASDARYLARAGADVVVCGPGEIALAHTARESLDLEELERAAVAYALAFARLLAPQG